MGFFKDIIGQLWTFVGLFIAWLVLEGTAKEVVGWVILASTIIWVATFPFRNRE